MLKYVCSAVLITVAACTKTSVSPTQVDTCQLPLPIGCSCVQDRTAISVECSGAQMTSVPKHWFGSGNLVVKTLNLERNNISEVRIVCLLWSPYVMGAIIFLPCHFYLLSIYLLSLFLA